MRWKLLLILFFSISLINFAYAGFNFSDTGSSINTQYGTSDYLKAKINISFQNEPLSSSFQDTLGNSINMSDLLTKIPSSGYVVNLTLQTINSDFQVINFDSANFSMPNTARNLTYQLNFSGEQIFSTQIKITSTGNFIPEEINRKYIILNNSKTNIEKFDISTRQILKGELNLSNIENRLIALENQYKKASPEEYEEILQNLSEINVPKTISETKSTTPISFYPKSEIINLDVLGSIAGEGNYSAEKESQYINALYLWNSDNLETRLTFKEISIVYEKENEIALKLFKFQFDKRNLKDTAYFIMEDLGDIKFSGDYSEKEQEGYIYIELTGISEIDFSTKQEDVNFINVPVFIAPSLNNFPLVDTGTITPYIPNVRKWILFGLIIFLLLLIGITAYVTLQIWYRRQYENSLFKNRNNLYNIMAYIQNSKRKGMNRGNIMKNLRKAKWRREQVNYAMNKYEGRKIAGIIDRPFKKVLQTIERDIERYPRK
jgi:hypothetical protein